MKINWLDAPRIIRGPEIATITVSREPRRKQLWHSNIVLGAAIVTRMGWTHGIRVRVGWGEDEDAGFLVIARVAKGGVMLRHKSRSLNVLAMHKCVPAWVGEARPREECLGWVVSDELENAVELTLPLWYRDRFKGKTTDGPIVSPIVPFRGPKVNPFDRKPTGGERQPSAKNGSAGDAPALATTSGEQEAGAQPASASSERQTELRQQQAFLKAQGATKPTKNSVDGAVYVLRRRGFEVVEGGAGHMKVDGKEWSYQRVCERAGVAYVAGDTYTPEAGMPISSLKRAITVLKEAGHTVAHTHANSYIVDGKQTGLTALMALARRVAALSLNPA